MTDESLHIPFTRRHVRTGKPRGARPGNTNAFKHGRRSKAHVERRKALVWLMRKVREATARAKASD
jgi:hypothetical protein